MDNKMGFLFVHIAKVSHSISFPTSITILLFKFLKTKTVHRKLWIKSGNRQSQSQYLVQIWTESYHQTQSKTHPTIYVDQMQTGFQD